MSKCAPRKSSYDSASLQASAVSEKPPFFFLIIEFSSRHKVIEGRIIENQTRYATWKEQKKKKADYEITKKKWLILYTVMWHFTFFICKYIYTDETTKKKKRGP